MPRSDLWVSLRVEYQVNVFISLITRYCYRYRPTSSSSHSVCRLNFLLLYNSRLLLLRELTRVTNRATVVFLANTERSH